MNKKQRVSQTSQRPHIKTVPLRGTAAARCLWLPLDSQAWTVWWRPWCAGGENICSRRWKHETTLKNREDQNISQNISHTFTYNISSDHSFDHILDIKTWSKKIGAFSAGPSLWLRNFRGGGASDEQLTVGGQSICWAAQWRSIFVTWKNCRWNDMVCFLTQS